MNGLWAGARWAAMFFTGFLTSSASGVAAAGPAESGAVFVQLFEWRWKDVAKECEMVLGPAGFQAVQVSPPNEHIDHNALPDPYRGAWWARYQPVSFRLDSRSGSEDEFRSMVERCEDSGVEVYADAVINHMADNGDRGVAGTPFDRATRSYVAFDDSQFHEPCVIAAEDYWLNDQPSAAEARARAMRVRVCQLGQLPDLATESEDVRSVLGAYLDSLLDTGVRGLRIDAAKHMQPDDVGAILAELSSPSYVFQEVIDTRGQSVSVDDYLANGAITEFLYSLRLGEAFARHELQDLETLNEAGGLLPSTSAVVFVDNHDNQRGHGMAASTTHRDGATYQLANTFMLAWPYGYPRLMSSYEWGGEDDNRGPPADDAGNTLPVHLADGSSDCGNGRWICEHRNAQTLRMVSFRRNAFAAGAVHVANWWADDTALAFSLNRSAGMPYAQIVLNASKDTLRTQIPTSLPDSAYCALEEANAECGRHAVVDGKLEVVLPPESSLVLEMPMVAAAGAAGQDR
ncbi:MAG: alpha-amylase family glycosyl hydrolase [Pseudomonadota bacterium]